MKPARHLATYAALILGGLAAGVALLVAIELTLRRLDIPPERGLFTAAVAPDGTRIMRLSWNPQFNKPQEPQAQRDFLATKPPGTFRIFVVGESSAEGSPYGTSLAFSSWLARRLAAEAPEVRWEVVNAALAGAQAGSMLAMVRDIARHAPDLLIVYLGHNEIGARLTDAERSQLKSEHLDLRALAARLRLYRLVARALPSRAKTIDLRDADRPERSVVRLGSPRDYASTADRVVLARLYRARIAEMVQIMRDAGARTALLTLSQNFSGWPPNVSVHNRRLPPEAKAAWRRAVRQGDVLAPSDCPGALTAWRSALALDDGFALLHFKIAGCEQRLGHLDEARSQYRLASDLDRFSQGAPLAFNAILRDVAAREGAILIDVDTALIQASGDRLVGDDLFVDAVHPNLRGHQLIAEAVADALRLGAIPVPASHWRAGAYVDPDPASVVAADPELAVKERLSHALCCYAAGRTSCALRDLDAAKDLTKDENTRTMIQHALLTAPTDGERGAGDKR